MHPASTSVTSISQSSLTSQHVMLSHNISSNPECWSSSSSLQTGADNVDHNNFQPLLPPTVQQEEVKESEMKPLDLSLRAPRHQQSDNNAHTSSWPRLSSMSLSSRSGSQRLSPYPILTQSSGSLSSSPSYRHHGSPNLSQSRSPLTRSVSPYYPYHRSTPSPYYHSGSCTPPDNCSSLQVLSSTNRLLNALSSVATSHLRSFDDSSSSPAPPELMGVCEPSRLMKDSEMSNQRQHHHHQSQHQLQQQNDSNREVDVDVESEEPTYIDMDSSTTVVKSVSSSRHQSQQHHSGGNHGMSSMYDGKSVMSSSSSKDLHMSQLASLPTSQPHLHHHDLSPPSSNYHPVTTAVATGPSPSHELPNFHPHQSLQQRSHLHSHSHLTTGSVEYPQTSVTSCPSFTSNNLQMSHPSLSLSSPSPSRSLSSSHTMHLCDSSNSDSSTSRDDICSSSYPFYRSENQSNAVPTSTLNSNPSVEYVRDIRMDLHGNHNQQQNQDQQHLQHQQTPTVVKEMLDTQQLQQQHQNPDSSSSPSAVRESSSSIVSYYSSTTSSSPWRATSTNVDLASPGNNCNNSNSSSTISGNSPISFHQRPITPQMSPDSNISRSALSILQSPSSNKENIRFINGGSSAMLSLTNTTNTSVSIGNGSGIGSEGSGLVSSGSTSARRSFFQIDKSRLEENRGSTLLADHAAQNVDDASRCSVLDFWISKILMEESPRRRCSADIRQTVDGNKRIRLRLVDLIELQVEQSLLKA